MHSFYFQYQKTKSFFRKLNRQFILKAVVLSAAAITSGCVHHFSRSDYYGLGSYEDFVNRKIADNLTSAKLKNDSAVVSNNVRLLRDSVICMDIDYPGKYDYHGDRAKTGKVSRSFPVSNVTRLSYSDHINGLMIGLGSGCVLGAVTGIALNYIGSSSSHTGQYDKTTENMLIGAATGSVLGVVLGGVIGDNYIFDTNEPEAVSPNWKSLRLNRFVINAGYNSGNKYIGIKQDFPYFTPYSTFGASRNPGFLVSLKYLSPIGDKLFIVPEIAYRRTSSNETYYLVPVYSPSHSNALLSGSSDEELTSLSLSLQSKYNFVDMEKFSLYAEAGPGISWLTGKKSGKEKFFAELLQKYGTMLYGTSGSYRPNIWYGTIGLGASLRHFAPYELFIQMNYNFDLTSRFEIYYDQTYSFRYDNIELRFGASIF